MVIFPVCTDVKQYKYLIYTLEKVILKNYWSVFSLFLTHLGIANNLNNSKNCTSIISK